MDLITNITKMVFINVCIFYISFKINNYKIDSGIKIFLFIILAISISIIYSTLINYINAISILLIIYILYSVIFGFFTGNKFSNSIVSTAISVSITYIFYIVSVMGSGIVVYLLHLSESYNNKSNFIIIAIIEILLIFLLFKNKRFKNGFYFIKNKSKSIDIISYSMIFCLIIINIYNLLRLYINTKLNTILLTIIICIAFILVIWIQNQITKQYKKNMRDRTIEIQKKEIDEQLKIIEEIKAENLKLAKAIHKYNSRLSALELGIKNTIEKNSKTEFADELSVILDEAHEISKGFSEETTINNKKLPLTNIIGIDNMFKYFQREANKNNINFDLIVNESINPLLEKIDKAKFETLIGDHLKDAIIAVSESKNSFKSILVILGIIENCYEFSVCDTGIEFEIDTLLKLGLEQVTTHKDTGGSGIGFITTFETLKECKASLIIEEYNPNTTTYTKSVTIRFDNKNKYKICSYRADEIKKKNKGNRIIIENL